MKRTPAEFNLKAAEFWERENEWLADRIKSRPLDLDIALRAFRKESATTADFAQVPDLHSRMRELGRHEDDLRPLWERERQSNIAKRARQRSRPISDLILRVLEKDPKASARSIRDFLAREAIARIELEICDQRIEWIDESGKSIQEVRWTSLASTISKLKRRSKKT